MADTLSPVSQPLNKMNSPPENISSHSKGSAPPVILNDSEPSDKSQPAEALRNNIPSNDHNKSGEDVDTSSAPRENFHSRVRKDRVSIETLRTYHIDYYIDTDPEHIIITRTIPDYEMNFLERHTIELRKECLDQTQLQSSQGPDLKLEDKPTIDSHSVLPFDHVQPGLAQAPSESSEVLSTAKKSLLLQINRVPFEKWLGRRDDNKREESVLDVATMPKSISERDSYINTPSNVLRSESSSPGRQLSAEIPVRLAINSWNIQFQLTDITGHMINNHNKVMHPPWKLLVTYDEEIKKRLHDLENGEIEGPGVNLTEENERPEQVPAAMEIKSRNLKGEDHMHIQETNYSTSHVCAICNGLDLQERLECLRTTISHLKCLTNFIDDDLKHVFELREGLKAGSIKEISFEDLWHLFTPGDLLITSGPRRERQAYNVFYTSGGRHIVQNNENFQKHSISAPFTIQCYYIGCDKKWIGPIHQTLSISQYKGKRPITALTMSCSDTLATRADSSAFPIRFLEDAKTAIVDLVRRGKRYYELIPFSHKRYCGPSSVEDPEYLNSEIIIDFEREEDNLIATIGNFDEIRMENEEIAEGCTFDGPCYNCSNIFNDNVIDKSLARRYKQDQHLLGKRVTGDHNLAEDHFMLFPAVINAFVLQERDTFGIYVDLVKDLNGDHAESAKALKKQSGFEDLVLPEGHGDLVEALVRTHRSTSKPRDEEAKVQVDLIDGKGEGLVILLHGVPGVGKTSTAECVAAYTRRPLYPITCANIGLDPEQVEQRLTGPDGHFRRAQQWNCVVLLDEADVFLAKRETHDNDSKRNALVSVFLRTLEYYPGILILTTNRVGSFDEAVVSRIQLFLYYPPLDKDKTMRVWRVHINRVRASGMINIDYEDEASIMEFAEEEYAEGRRWNGRQIRNFFQTAISLASYEATKRHQQSIEDGRVDKNSEADKPRLSTRKLKIVAATSGKFIDYINSTVPDGSHQKQQLDMGNRNDGWEDTPKKKK